MDKYKLQILALVPDEESINEMIEACFGAPYQHTGKPFIKRIGHISALLAFFIAQSRNGSQLMTKAQFESTGIGSISEEELKFAFWLLLISDNLNLKSELIKLTTIQH